MLFVNYISFFCFLGQWYFDFQGKMSMPLSFNPLSFSFIWVLVHLVGVVGLIRVEVSPLGVSSWCREVHGLPLVTLVREVVWSRQEPPPACRCCPVVLAPQGLEHEGGANGRCREVVKLPFVRVQIKYVGLDVSRVRVQV